MNKDNTKALFRKAKAYGELGYFERAEPIFLDLIKKTPAGKFTSRRHVFCSSG